MHSKTEEQIGYDYCIVACGCNFGLFDKWGESLWSALGARRAFLCAPCTWL